MVAPQRRGLRRPAPLTMLTEPRVLLRHRPSGRPVAGARHRCGPSTRSKGPRTASAQWFGSRRHSAAESWRRARRSDSVSEVASSRTRLDSTAHVRRLVGGGDHAGRPVDRCDSSVKGAGCPPDDGAWVSTDDVEHRTAGTAPGTGYPTDEAGRSLRLPHSVFGSRRRLRLGRPRGDAVGLVPGAGGRDLAA